MIKGSLSKKIKAQDPDAILFAGDIADDHNSNDGTVSLLNGIATEYPSYYVSGNHEIWSNQIGKIKSIFAMRGIKILEGDVKTAEFNGQTINICGVDDPEIGEETFQRQLQNTSHFNDQNYTILLSHRPERMEEYAKNGYDLVLSGHSHSGQWRIPLISNGLYAPSQGNFPKYSGGKYVMGGTTMIVGRGLQKNIGKYRRIFNPPELVVIDIEPK